MHYKSSQHHKIITYIHTDTYRSTQEHTYTYIQTSPAHSMDSDLQEDKLPALKIPFQRKNKQTKIHGSTLIMQAIHIPQFHNNLITVMDSNDQFQGQLKYFMTCCHLHLCSQTCFNSLHQFHTFNVRTACDVLPGYQCLLFHGQITLFPKCVAQDSEIDVRRWQHYGLERLSVSAQTIFQLHLQQLGKTIDLDTVLHSRSASKVNLKPVV